MLVCVFVGVSIYSSVRGCVLLSVAIMKRLFCTKLRSIPHRATCVPQLHKGKHYFTVPPFHIRPDAHSTHNGCGSSVSKKYRLLYFVANVQVSKFCPVGVLVLSRNASPQHILFDTTKATKTVGKIIHWACARDSSSAIFALVCRNLSAHDSG